MVELQEYQSVIRDLATCLKAHWTYLIRETTNQFVYVKLLGFQWAFTRLFICLRVRNCVFKHVCMCIYIYIHKYVYRYIYIYTFVYNVYIHLCTYMFFACLAEYVLFAWLFCLQYIYIYTHRHSCVERFNCIHVYMYWCIHVYALICRYTFTDVVSLRF